MSLSPSPSMGSDSSTRSSSSHTLCKHKVHIFHHEFCLSCLNDRSRSKSSGSLISKLARKFGRNSMKPDQYAHEAPPPSEENDEDGPITMVVSEGHTLQVPIPRLQQQKKLKSMSTSHLDSSYDG